MSEEIQKIPQKPLATLPEWFKELCKIIAHVNQLRSYPLTAIEIAEWSRSMKQLFPDLDYDALMFLISEMKAGRAEYDDRLGIRNLTMGMGGVEKTINGYRILKTIW